MATSTAPISAPVLSKKQRRAAQRKQRRKRKRQALAQARESGLEAGGSCISDEDINDEVDEDISIAEEERMRLHEQWLEKERIAQEEFRLRVEREEAARKRKEDEERMIKEEWEAQQQREQEEREHKLQEKRDKENQPSYSLPNHYSTLSSHIEDEAVQKMLDEAENQLDNGPWMNPEAPMTKTQSSQNFGTERDVTNCPFFLKTGACRFGERCSRKHVYPATSPTLMIRGMFTTFGMEESRRDDYDIDACLEHTEEELQESFFEFYHDVLPEFKSVGKVVQFKVSCNYEPHLKGNVYIQFDTEEQCKEAFIKFNGRWYAGRQLQCELCPVTRWKNAICGLFDRQKCPKGKHCNFLHVFRNPGHEFWEADRDLHMSPDRSVRSSRRDGWHSERYGDRSWKHRNSSRSPPISERSHSRREDNRRRSRSRERRASYQDKEDKWVSRSRHRAKRIDRYLSSRDRVRSRSREKEQDRLRHRSRDKDSKHRYRNRSEERDLDEDTFREMRERSRSTSTERKRNRLSRERSPSKIKKNSNGETNTHSCSKRSKKSKKKSKKKKRKKKSHLSNATSSSGESEKGESDEEGENLSANGPSERICESKPTLKNSDIDINVDTETLSPKPTTEIAVSLLETVT